MGYIRLWLLAMLIFSKNTYGVERLSFDEICTFIQNNIARMEVLKMVGQERGPNLPIYHKKVYGELIKIIVRLGDQVIKVWSSRYPCNASFEKAIQVGFFEGIGVPIDFYIEGENGVIQGYGCKYYDLSKRCLISSPIKEKGMHRSIPQENLANPKFRSFVTKIAEASRKFGLHYYDFLIDNVVVDKDGTFYLIDLESLKPYKKERIEAIGSNNPLYYAHALLNDWEKSRDA